MTYVKDIEGLVNDGRAPSRRWDEHIQVRVPRRTLRRFRKLMPMRGALSWFVREALSAFVQEMEDTPQDVVVDTVKRMHQDLKGGRSMRMFMRHAEEEDRDREG